MSKQRVVIIDTETTGLKPGVAGIISVGAVAVDYSTEEGPKNVERFYVECNPGDAELHCPGSDRALEINGFTRPQIRKFQPARRAAAQLHEFLERTQPDWITSYNVAFDSEHLALSPWCMVASRGFRGECLMLCAHQASCEEHWSDVRINRAGNRCWPKLDVAAARLGVREEHRRTEGAAHHADDDAMLAARVATRLWALGYWMTCELPPPPQWLIERVKGSRRP